MLLVGPEKHIVLKLPGWVLCSAGSTPIAPLSKAFRLVLGRKLVLFFTLTRERKGKTCTEDSSMVLGQKRHITFNQGGLFLIDLVLGLLSL